MNTLYLCLTVFVTQVVFIYARTYNVRVISRGETIKALVSGGIIHLSWLVSIAIGADSAHDIITEFNWSKLPVVASSLIGGLIGTYYGIKEKKQRAV